MTKKIIKVIMAFVTVPVVMLVVAYGLALMGAKTEVIAVVSVLLAMGYGWLVVVPYANKVLGWTDTMNFG